MMMDLMKILLNGKNSLEERFSEIDVAIVRKEMELKCNPEKIPQKIKKVIASADFPDNLIKIVEKAVA